MAHHKNVAVFIGGCGSIAQSFETEEDAEEHPLPSRLSVIPGKSSRELASADIHAKHIQSFGTCRLSMQTGASSRNVILPPLMWHLSDWLLREASRRQ